MLDRKFSQWDEIKPYLTASYQATHEPAVVEQTEAGSRAPSAR